jgi:hypothetical protein
VFQRKAVPRINNVNQAIIERDGSGIGAQDEQSRSEDSGKRSSQPSHGVPSRSFRPLHPELLNT